MSEQALGQDVWVQFDGGSSRIGCYTVLFQLPVEMATLDPKLLCSARHIPTLRPQFCKNEFAFEGFAGFPELKLSVTIGTDRRLRDRMRTLKAVLRGARQAGSTSPTDQSDRKGTS
jgi:hypothetical protein